MYEIVVLSVFVAGLLLMAVSMIGEKVERIPTDKNR